MSSPQLACTNRAVAAYGSLWWRTARLIAMDRQQTIHRNASAHRLSPFELAPDSTEFVRPSFREMREWPPSASSFFERLEPAYVGDAILFSAVFVFFDFCSRMS